MGQNIKDKVSTKKVLKKSYANYVVVQITLFEEGETFFGKKNAKK
ncbi:hypothetical protein RV02_GL003265 [Enterococcus gilvus]|nr:hypothetical protein RV02_GL003265 [Enterococcus gilvus]